jgi:hypothetical protein
MPRNSPETLPGFLALLLPGRRPGSSEAGDLGGFAPLTPLTKGLLDSNRYTRARSANDNF